MATYRTTYTAVRKELDEVSARADAPNLAERLHEVANKPFREGQFTFTLVSYATLRGDPFELRKALEAGGDPNAMARGPAPHTYDSLDLAFQEADLRRLMVGREACAQLLVEAGANLCPGYDGGVLDLTSRMLTDVGDPVVKAMTERLPGQVAAICAANGRCASITCAAVLADCVGRGLRGGRCQGCFRAKYCSARCQKEDWPFHSKWCRTTDSFKCYSFVSS